MAVRATSYERQPGGAYVLGYTNVFAEQLVDQQLHHLSRAGSMITDITTQSFDLPEDTRSRLGRRFILFLSCPTARLSRPMAKSVHPRRKSASESNSPILTLISATPSRSRCRNRRWARSSNTSACRSEGRARAGSARTSSRRRPRSSSGYRRCNRRGSAWTGSQRTATCRCWAHLRMFDRPRASRTDA